MQAIASSSCPTCPISCAHCPAGLLCQHSAASTSAFRGSCTLGDFPPTSSHVSPALPPDPGLHVLWSTTSPPLCLCWQRWRGLPAAEQAHMCFPSRACHEQLGSLWSEPHGIASMHPTQLSSCPLCHGLHTAALPELIRRAWIMHAGNSSLHRCRPAAIYQLWPQPLPQCQQKCPLLRLSRHH